MTMASSSIAEQTAWSGNKCTWTNPWSGCEREEREAAVSKCRRSRSSSAGPAAQHRNPRAAMRGSPIRKATDAEAASDFSTPPAGRARRVADDQLPVRSPPNGCVTPTASSTPPIAARRAMSFSSPTPLTPLPIAIDMPSPGLFDPLLEHFLQPLEPEAGMCCCTFERPRRAGAARCGCAPRRATCRCSAPSAPAAPSGSRLRRHAVRVDARRGGRPRAALGERAPAAPEVAAFLLGERELDARVDAAAARQLDARRDAARRGQRAGGAAERQGARPPAGRAARSAAPARRRAELPTRPLQDLQLWQSRLPVWDAERELLTLDFPPGRATLASVQNFQLVDAIPPRAAATPTTPRPRRRRRRRQPRTKGSSRARPRPDGRGRRARDLLARLQRAALAAAGAAAHRGAGLGVD